MIAKNLPKNEHIWVGTTHPGTLLFEDFGMGLLFLLGLVGAAAALAGAGGSDGDATTTSAASIDDDITGTPGPDEIYTEGGNDTVNALGGNDTVGLGAGDDTADAGEGDDTVYGGAGSDDVSGGPGDDRIFLGDGNDIAIGFGDPTTDHAGDDLIRGGDGMDIIIDGVGSDEIYGELGADLLSTIDIDGSPDAPDMVYGGFGADVIAGDDGDTLSGGDGEDGFAIWTDEADDAEVELSDYDASTEQLILEFDSGTFPAYTNADITSEVVGDDLRILVAGKAIALLKGTNSFDPTLVSVNMV